MDNWEIEEMKTLKDQKASDRYSIVKHNGYFCLALDGQVLPKQIKLESVFDEINSFHITCEVLCDPNISDPKMDIKNQKIFYEGKELPFVNSVKLIENPGEINVGRFTIFYQRNR